MAGQAPAQVPTEQSIVVMYEREVPLAPVEEVAPEGAAPADVGPSQAQQETQRPQAAASLGTERSSSRAAGTVARNSAAGGSSLAETPTTAPEAESFISQAASQTAVGEHAVGESGGQEAFGSGFGTAGSAHARGGHGKAGGTDGAPAAPGSRKVPARLLASHTCDDLFPYSARSEAGSVTVLVTVSPSGSPESSQVLQVSPPGQGFELAAKACASRFKFLPARDPSHHRVRSSSRVQVRFSRSDA